MGEPLEMEVRQAIEQAVAHLVARQQPDGSWRGEYGGPLFLLPNYVIAHYVAGRPIEAARVEGMVRYLLSTQNKDGSVGLYDGGPGCLFTTAITYVALRILGASPDDDALTAMRRWIHAQGGPLGAANWGKFMLAFLNLYRYEGINPVLPELWLLPYHLPIHPGRLWCHTRQVYLPLSWLYAMRSHMQPTPLIEALRAELYDRPYAAIDFTTHRDTIAPCDNLYPIHALMRAANVVQNAYEGQPFKPFRRRALAEVMRHIRYEDRVTNWVALGPVNRVLNALVYHFNEPGGAEEEQAFAAMEQYLCETPRGIHMNGYSSTALWDTVFAVQALHAAGGVPEQVLISARDFIRENQIRREMPNHEEFYRSQALGGWPFGDATSGWPVTDCTAEGLRCALELASLPGAPVAPELLDESVTLLLAYQNDDGGWSSYEEQRSPGWLERLNPSNVFGNIMVEHSYVECTAAVIRGLLSYQRRFPTKFSREIARALAHGAAFLRNRQGADGSFYGSWGVCYTYGAWFGIEGLRALGAGVDDPAIVGAVAFLTTHQNADGGWGEAPESCLLKRWVTAESHSVQTAWALLALCEAGAAASDAARRAAAFLVERQEMDGSWPKERMVGVFNQSVLIDYDNYRRYFPLWALARWRHAVTS